MQTLTYGRKLPADGDRGSIWFDALEDNIQLNDTHDHDGANSPKLSSTAIVNSTQAISNANWGSPTNGLYKQTIAMPGGLAYDTSGIQIRNTANGAAILTTIIKITATSYDIYINDNSLNLTAVYV